MFTHVDFHQEHKQKIRKLYNTVHKKRKYIKRKLVVNNRRYIKKHKTNNPRFEEKKFTVKDLKNNQTKKLDIRLDRCK